MILTHTIPTHLITSIGTSIITPNSQDPFSIETMLANLDVATRSDAYGIFTSSLQLTPFPLDNCNLKKVIPQGSLAFSFEETFLK